MFGYGRVAISPIERGDMTRILRSDKETTERSV